MIYFLKKPISLTFFYTLTLFTSFSSCQTEVKEPDALKSSQSQSETTSADGSAVIVGTVTNRGTWDFSNSPFPGAGYYYGVTNLPEQNSYCKNITVLGNKGSAICLDPAPLSNPALPSHLLMGKEAWDSSGKKIIGSIPNQGVWNLSTTAYPGSGFYSQITGFPSSSALCSSNTLQGIPGTAICQTGSTTQAALSSHILAGKEAWDPSGMKITGSLLNQGSFDLSKSFPGSGFYSGVSHLPDSSQIIEGVTLLGITGTALTRYDSLMASSLFRNSGGTPSQLSIAAEKSNGTLPSGYREIPDITKDDNGVSGSSIQKSTRPTTSCGNGGVGIGDRIENRIAHCLAQNPNAAIWDGTVKGNSGEGVWKLVTFDAVSGSEVWRDERTGFLWSSAVSQSNWCRASGNAQANDPNNICNSSSNQNQISPTSFCVEGNGLSPAKSGENWTTGIYHSSKGGMGKISSSFSPSVRWRLPTLNDYYIALANGLSSASPHFNHYAWTSTLNSSDRSYAFIVSGSGKILSDSSQRNDATIFVHCIGR